MIFRIKPHQRQPWAATAQLRVRIKRRLRVLGLQVRHDSTTRELIALCQRGGASC